MMMIHRTLTKLTFGGTHQPATMEISAISVDLSGKELWPSGASVLAAFLPKCTYVLYMYLGLYPLLILQSDIPNTLSDIRALTHLDVSSSDIGQLVPPEGWEAHANGTHYRQHGGDWTITVPAGAQPLGVIAIAIAIPDMGVLSVLSLKNNALGTKEAGKVLGEMLKENSVLKELDLSDNRYYNGGWFGWKTDPEFAEELAAGIKDNGAISSVNLLKNNIGVAQADDLVSILKDHPTLKSLCGNKGNETALDMSGKVNGAADAIMLVTEIIDNGVISTFTFSGDHHDGSGLQWKRPRYIWRHHALGIPPKVHVSIRYVPTTDAT
jgi:hypothetical protein